MHVCLVVLIPVCMADVSVWVLCYIDGMGFVLLHRGVEMSGASNMR